MLIQSEVQLELYPGSELAIDSNLPARIESGEVLTFNDSRKIALLEMPPEVVPPNLDKFFWTLQARGINIVLAHPERNYLLSKNPSVLLDWIQDGFWFRLRAPDLSVPTATRSAIFPGCC
jgi:protein-tyrosine phosphatase